MPKIINANDFGAEVLKSELPVIVDFFASWCNPCTTISRILDEISMDFAGKVKIVKLDYEKSKDTAKKYGIKRLPTLVFFNNGEIVDHAIGIMEKNQIAQKLNSLIESF